VQADLENAHLLNPLSYGATDPALYEVARELVVSKGFLVPASSAGKRLTLVFDGVDERCVVWLNGERLGETRDVSEV